MSCMDTIFRIVIIQFRQRLISFKPLTRRQKYKAHGQHFSSKSQLRWPAHLCGCQVPSAKKPWNSLSAFSFRKRLRRLSSSGALLFLVGNKFRRHFAYAKQLCCPCSSGAFQHFAYAKPASLSALLCCALLRIPVWELSTAKKGGQPLAVGVCFSKLTDWGFPNPSAVSKNLKNIFFYYDF